MDDSELLRYSRHILLDQIGIEGQEKIKSSSVLVIGAGGTASVFNFISCFFWYWINNYL